MSWPVATEVDLVLRSRGYLRAAIAFAEAPRDGVHKLLAPEERDLRKAIEFGNQYADSGADLITTAIAANRDIPVFTWDFRHFRTVIPAIGRLFNFLVEESELF